MLSDKPGRAIALQKFPEVRGDAANRWLCFLHFLDQLG
jgi:hypothetical protein